MSPALNTRTPFVLALVLSALLLADCASKPASADTTPPPPPEVEVMPVAQENVKIFSEWVATIDGNVNAQIQPQVTGYVIRQDYEEGAFVRKGQVLFEIDPRPLQAIVDQARGQVAQAESQVAQAQSQVIQAESQEAQAVAQMGKAELDVKRDTPLAKARAIAQSQLDSEAQALAAAEAGVKASRAMVVTSRAGIKTAEAAVVAAKANLSQAELNLSFTQVRSLVDGIAGIAQTQIGNLVKVDTVLTTVSQVDPVRVYFPISEREYLALALKANTGANVALLNGAQTPSLELILTNGETYSHKGRIIFVDRQVDPETGTIRVAASFPNPGNILRPGQFGRIRTLTSQRNGALLVPQRAVTELQGKYQVAVVAAGNKVQLRNISLGPAEGPRYVVDSGLSAGEYVVVEGLAKAMDGSTVTPKSARLAPPADSKAAQGK